MLKISPLFQEEDDLDEMVESRPVANRWWMDLLAGVLVGGVLYGSWRLLIWAVGRG